MASPTRTVSPADSPDPQRQHSVTVNGAPCALDGTDPSTTTLDWLRAQGLTGAKEGCAEGECGACSIMVARPTRRLDGTQWTAINACLVPAAALDGQEVVTAEGLGTPDALHPVQREMAVRGGSQCGYCTPGFICSMAAEYYREGRCAPRCVPTRRRTATSSPTAPSRRPPTTRVPRRPRARTQRLRPARPVRQPVPLHRLPPDPRRRLRARRARRRRPVCRAAGRRPAGRRPTRLDGTTGTFARPAISPRRWPCWPSTRTPSSSPGPPTGASRSTSAAPAPPSRSASTGCPSCATLSVGEDTVEIGAALSLSEVERALAGRIPLLDKMFPQFASRLIRNGATIGGNLGTGSPIGDTPPALLALEAVVVLASADGDREVPLADYFTGYRQTVKRAGELIRAVRIPLPLSEVTAFHKIAKRRFDDISSVAVGFALDLRDGVVAKARIGLGGVAATPIRALATEAALEGRAWSADGRPRGGRRDARRRHADGRPPRQRGIPHGDARHGAAQAARRDRDPAGGRSMSALSERPANAVVGQEIPHEAAALHVTGDALYTDDLAVRTHGILHAHPVQAPHAHALVTRLDTGTGARSPASCGSSPPRTCRGSTTPGSSTTSRCSRRR